MCCTTSLKLDEGTPSGGLHSHSSWNKRIIKDGRRAPNNETGLCPQQQSILPSISPSSPASFHPSQLGAISSFTVKKLPERSSSRPEVTSCLQFRMSGADMTAASNKRPLSLTPQDPPHLQSLKFHHEKATRVGPVFRFQESRLKWPQL